MLNDAKNKKRFLLDKFLILLAIISVIFAVLTICLYLDKAEIAIFVKNANHMKKSYTSTETNTWDISANEDGSVIATLSDDGTLTISGEGNMKGWPNLSNLPWYSIRNQINKVKIENGVSDIGYRAFYDCNNLTTVEIPSSVTTIGDSAFEGCYKLISVKIPDGVTSIGDSAFYYCKSLTSIEIPSSVTSIGDYVFDSCFKLTNIEVNENNAKYKDVDGVLYSKDGTQIIVYPAGKKDEEYKILSGVTTISSWAFEGCYKLISVKIPDGVTTIGDFAFCDCYILTNIEIPNSVTSIGVGTFSHCESLTNIEITNSVTSIGEGAFYNCVSLTNIEIPNSVTSIGDYVFDGCFKLTNIEVNENNTNYKDDNGVLYTKDGAQIIKYPEGKENEEYKILSGVTTIGDSAFEGCYKLISVKIPDGVTTIGDYAFSYCESLTNIDIPNSITSIGDYAFRNCKLTKFIEGGNTRFEMPLILKRAQEENDILYTSEVSLTNCTIEDGIIEINEGETFAKIEINGGKLNGLTYIISYNSWNVSKDENQNVIATLSNDGTLTISGTGNMKDYSSTNPNPWFDIAYKINAIKIEEGITSIGDGAFADCYNLTNIEISNSVTSIGVGAFADCYSLTNIEIPNSVTSMGDYAFSGCFRLISVEIPNSVTSIGKWVFGGCFRLTSVKIPNGVTSIGDHAFYYCYSLTNIEIPNSVTSIGEYAFYYCESLTNIEIPNSVTSIGDEVFDACYNLTILCHKNSTALIYAQENDIDYLIIMDKIQTKTTVQQIKQQMGANTEYKITDKNGNIIADNKQLTTGCKVETSNGENYIIIIEGDVNKDGNTDIRDILAINKYRLNKANLEIESRLASDVNEDDVVDIRDILQINKFRLGKTSSL